MFMLQMQQNTTSFARITYTSNETCIKLKWLSLILGTAAWMAFLFFYFSNHKTIFSVCDKLESVLLHVTCKEKAIYSMTIGRPPPT